MKKKIQKIKPKTDSEIFIREWILLCLDQLGYSTLLEKQEKTVSAIDLLQNNEFLIKEEDSKHD